MRQSDPYDLLPLGAPVFHVLLALGHERLHGYAIMQAVEKKTGGAARILPGTLYATLNRMLADGLVEDAPAPEDSSDDDRRGRCYRITPFGLKVVAAEARRMSVLLEVARRDLQISYGT